ncbi:MAG TPA: glycoside hydrolase family 30 protein [Clostridiaceae bacterium]
MNNIIQVYITSKNTKDRLTKQEPHFFSQDKNEIEAKLLKIYEDVTYQEILGFGGAFTEAASVTIDKMSDDKKKEILEAYFSLEKGIGYSFLRTHINSCDFSTENYAYDEVEGDYNLEKFSIDRDKKSLIPLIKSAQEASEEGFILFASPWSPPAWMKTNGQMNEGGKLKDECKEAWAKYYAKYIKAYKNEGINIWGITVQNEPKATQTWDSCVYTAEEERDFVRDYLGPILQKEGLSDIKIMIWDHNKERAYDRSKVIYVDEEASKYVYGTAFHWYSGDHFGALDALHHKFPDKKLIFTEGCVEFGVKLGSWTKGETYGHAIMGDMKNYTSAWTDWNIVLDEIGGPNHVGNYCDAPIIAETKINEVFYESSYYYIGHFSKFVRPGAYRIGLSSFSDKLEAVAFKNKNGEIVTVALNRTDEEIQFNLGTNLGISEFLIPAHSIMTLVY